MQNRTNLGASLGQLLASGFNPAFGAKGAQDAAALAQAESVIDYNRARTESEFSDNQIKQRQLKLNPDDLALGNLGVTGSLAQQLKSYAKNGDYGNGSINVPNMMEDGMMNLANSSIDQYIKPAGWDDKLANQFMKDRGVYDYGISMGEKNPENIQKAIGQASENQFMSGAGDDALKYGLRKAATMGKPEDIQKVQLLQQLAESGASKQDLEAAARALIIGSGKQFDFSKDGVGNQVTGQYMANPVLPGAKVENKQYDADRGVIVDVGTGKAVIPTVNGKPLPKSTKKAELSASAQKELFEADDVSQAAQNTIDMLTTAESLNKQAFSGFGASSRAWADKAIPDFLGGDEERAKATVDLDNIMATQALESLKITFGGSPTEGERKILLEIQASSEKTPAQRANILSRAKTMAKRRLKVASEKAKALREGTFFTTDRDIQGGPLGSGNQPPSRPTKIINGVTYENDGTGWKVAK